MPQVEPAGILPRVDDVAEPPIINFAGELVALGPMRRELLPLYWRWRNDFDIVRNLIDVNPVTFEQEAARHDKLEADPRCVRFTLFDRATLAPIGITALDDIDYRNGVAEYSIVIGEAEFRSRGYGTEATRLMLDYAFTALGLHAIWLELFEFNPAAQRTYEKAGFRLVGRRREAHLADGRLWDIIYMDCLASEFENPVLGRIFAPDVPR